MTWKGRLKFLFLASRFVMKDGLLYYISKAESTDSADLRLYIPESLRHSYMVAFHDSAGHLGVERMCRLLRARVYWPKLAVRRANARVGRQYLTEGGHAGRYLESH
eukprot:scaffold9840_cov139-Isochrysis_galbana.AAC.1